MRRTAACLTVFLAAISRCEASGQSETRCGALESVSSKSGDLIFTSNAWNPDGSGSQCITVNADSTAFNATWHWPVDQKAVHSYPHVSFKSNYLPLPISDVTNLTLRGSWSMAATPPDELVDTGIIANVAWDMFADTNATAAQSAVQAGYEIMFWMGSFGSPQPLGFASGPCLTATIRDIPFSLYCGTNPRRNLKTLSWLTESNVTDFDMDFNPLLQALLTNTLVPSNVSIGAVEFGTEAFYATKNVTFSASGFGMDLKAKSPPHKSQGSSGLYGQQHTLVQWMCIGFITSTVLTW